MARYALECGDLDGLRRMEHDLNELYSQYAEGLKKRVHEGQILASRGSLMAASSLIHANHQLN